MTPISRSSDKHSTIAVVGLGYVGLPLAVEFGKKMPTLGLDLSTDKVAAYRRHIDPTGEVSTQDLQAATQLQCHTDPAVLKEADFIIIAVPTPVGVAHQPDFTPLIKSSEAVGKHRGRYRVHGFAAGTRGRNSPDRTRAVPASGCVDRCEHILAETAKLVPKGLICLTSALAFPGGLS